MSRVLALASDFIERMSNPAYGVRVNEDYSMRFADLLSSEGFADLLSSEIEELKDPDTLSPHGWLWLLSWARSRKIRLDGKLMLDLTESLSSVFMQVATIDLATQQADWGRRETVAPLNEFDHRWMSKLLRRCTEGHGEKDMKYDHVDTRRSENTLIALMQVGSDITLDAASTLLNHHWPGQYSLVRFFWSLCGELDHETREVWISRLRPPKKPSNEFHEE
jgi:hypothetical protein